MAALTTPSDASITAFEADDPGRKKTSSSTAPAAAALPIPAEDGDKGRITRANAHDHARKKFPDAQLKQMERMVLIMRQVMASRSLSERAFARELGVTLGTTHKYFCYQVLPGRVATETMAKLAALAGVTVDALLRFFDSGELDSGIGRAEVETWIRSSASSEHLGWMFDALSAAAHSGLMQPAPPAPPALAVYDWPILALQQRGVTDKWRERMGLSDDVLKALAVDGVFDEELVDAFAFAMGGLDADLVRQAFTNRVPCETHG